MPEVNLQFELPRRQHGIGIVVLIGWQAQMLIRSLWPVLLAAWVQQDDEARYLVWAVFAVALISVFGALIHFWRFTFNVKDGKFHVHKGVFVREKINIPLERVQAVHVEQNVIQRVFKVCGLRVDTAGSSGSELRIHALRWEEAHGLRDMLTEESPLTNEQHGPDPSSSMAHAPSSNHALLTLDFKTLLKVGIAQNHLSKIAFVLGGFVTFQGIGWRWLQDFWSQALWIWKAILIGLSPILFLMIPVFIALGAVAFSMATSVFRHWKLSLWVQGSQAQKTMALHLTQGLLKRQSVQIPLHKIQWVMWENTLIRRMFWMDTVQIRQAAAGGGSEAASPSQSDLNSSLHMSIPAMNSERTRSLESILFPTWPEQKLITLRPARYAFWLRWVKRGMIWSPLLLLFGWMWGWGSATILGGILWSWIGWVSWKVYRGQWATTDGRYLSAHRGWWFRNRIMIDWNKLQAVQFVQNRIQAKRHVAHVIFHTSSGVIQLDHLPITVARELRDLAAARVNSHHGLWM